MSNVTDFPEGAKRELLHGPFEEWRITLEGFQIPRLTGERLGNGNVLLVLDHRFVGEFSEQDAWQVAHLVANALAIGAGYSWYGAPSKDAPFAPRVVEVSS